MRAPQSPKSWLGFLWLLPFLFGCGQEGIKEPVPDFQAPQNIDAVARKVVREAYFTLEQNPQSPEAWSTFANACLANEIFVEAISAYEIIISHNSEDADSIWRCAIALSELGDLDQAIELIQQHKVLFSCQPECSRRMAQWHFNNGDLEQAKTRLKDRENCGFDDYWMDVLEIEILISEGNFEKAKKAIQKYSPPYEEDLFRLAELSARRLDDESWMESLIETQPLKTRIPPDPRIDSLAPLNRTVLADRRRAEALVARPPTKQISQQLKYLHDARPNDSWFAATYAMSLLQLGEIERAALTLDQLNLDREQWTAEYWMVSALVRMKQYEANPNQSLAQSMLKACLHVIEIDPKHATAIKTSAKAYRLLGNFTAEAEAWEAASELASTTQEKLTCLGASFQAIGRAGDWTRASSSFDLLLEEIPEEQAKQFWAAAAQAAIKAERRNQALMYIQRLREVGYEDIAIQLEKGLNQ